MENIKSIKTLLGVYPKGLSKEQIQRILKINISETIIVILEKDNDIFQEERRGTCYYSCKSS